MKLIKVLFFAYLALIALAVSAYGVSRIFTPPRDPDTLYTTYIASVRSFDPPQIYDVISGDIAGHVYETLYNFRYGGRPDELIPQLAADLPTISPDGREYTIKLRPGVHFYDPSRKAFPDGKGPEVTAQDVIYSWKRFANFHLAAGAYSSFFQDNIEGLDDFRAYTEKAPEDKVDYDRPVSGLTALDDHTLRIRLTKPIPQFNLYLASLPTAITSRQAVEALGSLKEQAVGTGPYAMVEHLNEQRIVVEKNPLYRGRPDVSPGDEVAAADRLPRIKRIQWDYMPESLPAWYLFQQGRYDVTAIPKETFADVVTPQQTLNPSYAARGMDLRIRPDFGLYFLQFNVTDPVIGKNKALRQAMSLGIDRDTFIRVYRSGRGLPGVSMFPPEVPLYDPKYVGPFARFDPAAAKEKVAEAIRFHGGPLPTIVIDMSGSDTDDRQYAEFFVQQMAAIGITIKPEYNSFARYLEKLDNKKYQLAWAGWYPDYADEKTYLKLFDARLTKPPGSNTAGYVDDKYQALLQQAEIMQRSPERDRLYIQMRDIIDDELPAVPIFYPLVYSLSYDWLGNRKPPQFTMGFMAHHTLDTDKRRKALMGR